jgi:hypothetical protein
VRMKLPRPPAWLLTVAARAAPTAARRALLHGKESSRIALTTCQPATSIWYRNLLHHHINIADDHHIIIQAHNSHAASRSGSPGASGTGKPSRSETKSSRLFDICSEDARGLASLAPQHTSRPCSGERVGVLVQYQHLPDSLSIYIRVSDGAAQLEAGGGFGRAAASSLRRRARSAAACCMTVVAASRASPNHPVQRRSRGWAFSTTM